MTASAVADAAFSVRLAADPAALIRVLNLFAQQAMTPSRVHAVRSGDDLVVEIEQPDIDGHAAAVIAAKMRAFVLAADVRLERRLRCVA